jgi:hypothetical protein
MQRICIMIPEEMLAVVDAVAECDFSSRPAAILKLWTKVWGPATPDITKQTGEVRTDIKVNPSDRVDACPGHARARVDSPERQTDRKESFEPAEVAAAVQACNWFGLRLPKGETPLSYIADLMRAYPEMTPGQVYDAAMWLKNNPNKRKGRKYLGGFLTHWVRKGRQMEAEQKARNRRYDKPQISIEIPPEDMLPE